jgi:hypothetical protein
VDLHKKLFQVTRQHGTLSQEQNTLPGHPLYCLHSLTVSSPLLCSPTHALPAAADLSAQHSSWEVRFGRTICAMSDT